MKKIAIAIDFGASHLRAALVNKEGEILKENFQDTKKQGKSGKVLTGQITAMIEDLIGGEALKIAGIGISSIGPLDYKNGGVRNSPNLSFGFVPLASPLQKKFSLPVYLLNDCAASVLAEKVYGAGKETENLVYITISSGIGGGAIVDNHLLFGSKGNAVEIGHFIIEDKYNFLCSCSQGFGHWESLASGRNLPRFFNTWAKEKGFRVKYKTAKDIFEAAKNKDKNALYFVREVLGRINAKGVSNVIVAYNPSLITFGGAVALNNQKLILEPIKKHIDHFLTTPKMIITPLKEKIGLLGAAALVFLKTA
jgi:glucokinase